MSNCVDCENFKCVDAWKFAVCRQGMFVHENNIDRRFKTKWKPLSTRVTSDIGKELQERGRTLGILNIECTQFKDMS